MVQGTASSVGKSLLVTALCRIFAQDGLRVAPFKSQNMALNSYVTADGLEIGRAQAVQAEACGIPPTVQMNPILLKPEGAKGSQVVVLGKSVGSMTFGKYQRHKSRMCGVLAESLRQLRETYDLVLIEGAGSPAEINLRDQDIVNMHVARVADAPVLLVGDIDRGGVFASLVGTLELLQPDERERIAGFVINKFRGEISLLQPGLDWLEAHTGVPLLGTVPHIQGLRIAEEDSVALDSRRGRHAAPDELDIAVIRLPRIANYDDLEALEHEPGVVVRFVERAELLGQPDLLVLPGSKNTSVDLTWLRHSGFEPLLAARFSTGVPVLGICGGCQMLGSAIEDPDGVESDAGSVTGLGALPIVTRFEREKRTCQVTARVGSGSFLTGSVSADAELSGYYIHMGRIRSEGPSPFELLTPAPGPDGAISADGAVVGTMLHGILENDAVRGSLLAYLRGRRGLTPPAEAAAVPTREDEYDRLAAVVRESLDLARLRQIIDRSLTGNP